MSELVEGVVIETDGETCKVRCSVHSDCENCGVCPGTNAQLIDVVDTVGAQPGDSVVIEKKKSNMVLVAFMVYIFPFIAVGLGIGLGSYLANRLMFSSTLSMTLGGVIFGAAAIFIIKHIDRSMESETPVIIRNNH